MKKLIFILALIAYTVMQVYCEDDKSFIGDVNNDGREDLVLVNTSYGGGAIRAIDLKTGNNIAWINHGSFGGWMVSGDKMFLGDVNNDGREDLVLPKLSDFSKATVIAHSNHLPDNKSTGIITILLSYLNSYYLRGCHTGVAPA